MDTQGRTLNAVAWRAASVDEDASAGAIRSRNPTRNVRGADGGCESPRANDFAHDQRLLDTPAQGEQQNDVAPGETGPVKLLTQPARAGCADGSLDGEGRSAATWAVKIDPRNDRRRHARREIVFLPVSPRRRL